MIAELTNHLWQSTLFVLAAGLFALALRRNGAHVRHVVWLAASVKFLVPFSLLIGAGSLLARPDVTPAGISPTPSPAVSTVISQIAEPFSGPLESATPAPRPRASFTPLVVLCVWLIGVFAIVVARLKEWRRVRMALRASTPATIPGVVLPSNVELRGSPFLLEPGVIGVRRHVLLVPDTIDRTLTRPQLAAVIAHELCHVRRRDNLTASIHMAVEALFWFHPLVWWIGARLMTERERACDEHVLRELDEPRAYAEGIVTICQKYVESPIACVAGVTGSNLRTRIEAIMINRVGARLTPAQKFALVAAAVIAAFLPIGTGVITAPLRAAGQAAAAKPAAQKFEIASLKPCEPQPVPPGGRSGGGNGSFSPARAHLNCFVVRNLIEMAYINNRESPDPSDPINAWPGMLGRNPAGLQRLRGGPDWVYSDKYTIEAKAPGLDPSLPRNPDRAVMLGPMLRALLEDRFKLEVHQELEDAPMFAMTVAKGGLKIKPMEAGSCSTDSREKLGIDGRGPILLSEALRRGVKPTCGVVNGGPNGGNWRWEHGGQNLAVVATVLSGDLGVKILDRTGVTDRFNFMWEYAPDDTTPGPLAWLAKTEPRITPTAASVHTALREQLGLQLERITGKRGYLVIDRIERPTPDAPVTPRPARAQGAGR
jgi:uncharacterized protein (TIGR03435 family)